MTIRKIIMIAFACMLFAPVGAHATDANSAIAQMTSQRNTLNSQINTAVTTGKATEQVSTKGKGWVNAAGAAVGGAAGGILAWQATASIQKSQAQGAAREWMDNVGRHIRCFIGATEVGEFGDIISTEME